MKIALFLASLAVGLLMVSTACGGGGGGKKEATATVPVATTPSHDETPMGSPPSQEELQTAFDTARTQLQEVISKAQAGDLQGARDAYKLADDPLHMIEDALQAKGDADLANSIETKQHDGIEDPLKAGDPDLAAIAQAAQEILPLLDQAAAKLSITSSETPPSSAELAADLKDIKAVLQDTLAKAQAGDVQGTRDAEAKGDKSMEAVIKAVRLVDPALADQIENLELDYEAQADSATTDLTVIAKDAQDALLLLDQAGTKLGISP